MIRPDNHDPATGAALATLAIITTDLAHEAFGHGSACLLLGGRITLLNNAFFRCSAHSSFIDIAGPAGNLFWGFVALALLSVLPQRRTALRFYVFCVMAFSLFWETGYVIDSMLHARGDYAFAWEGFVGPLNGAVRASGIVIGIVCYLGLSRLVVGRARTFSAPGRTRLLRTAWASAVIAQAAAAALFAPDRLDGVHDAGLSAVAAFPLLLISSRAAAETGPPLARDLRIIAGGASGFLLFALTMGRGIY